jgi:hypothetical protein
LDLYSISFKIDGHSCGRPPKVNGIAEDPDSKPFMTFLKASRSLKRLKMVIGKE